MVLVCEGLLCEGGAKPALSPCISPAGSFPLPSSLKDGLGARGSLVLFCPPFFPPTGLQNHGEGDPLSLGDEEPEDLLTASLRPGELCYRSGDPQCPHLQQELGNVQGQDGGEMGEAGQPLHTACFPGKLWERKQSQRPPAKAWHVQECVGFPVRPIRKTGRETS